MQPTIYPSDHPDQTTQHGPWAPGRIRPNSELKLGAPKILPTRHNIVPPSSFVSIQMTSSAPMPILPRPEYSPPKGPSFQRRFGLLETFTSEDRAKHEQKYYLSKERYHNNPMMRDHLANGLPEPSKTRLLNPGLYNQKKTTIRLDYLG